MFVGTLILLRNDLEKALTSVGNDINGSYGLKVFFSHYSGSDRAAFPNSLVLWLLFITLFSIIVSTIGFSIPKEFNVKMQGSNLLLTFCLTFPVLFTITWLTSSNYPYRLGLVCLSVLIYSWVGLPGSLTNFLLATTFVVQFLSPATLGYLQNLLMIPLVALNLLVSIEAIRAALRKLPKKINSLQWPIRLN